MNAQELHRVLTKIGIDVARDSNGNFMACCPFHDESSPSWGISQSEPHYHGCFACHAKGTLYDLLIRVGTYSEHDARVTCKLGEADPVFDEFEADKFLFRPIAKENLYPYSLTKTAMRYLKKRRILLVTAKKLGLLFHHKDRRILFPWYVGKQLVNVTGRAIDACNDDVKTLPYFGGKKSNFLYLPSRRIRKGPIVLVEGEIDAAIVYQANAKNVAAIGHGRFAKGQKRMLLESPATEIICFFDNDKTGRALVQDTIDYFAGKKAVSAVNYKLIPDYRLIRKHKLDPAYFHSEDVKKILHYCVERNADWPEI